MLSSLTTFVQSFVQPIGNCPRRHSRSVIVPDDFRACGGPIPRSEARKNCTRSARTRLLRLRRPAACWRSSIIRPMNELEEWNVGRIPPVHDLRADHTFRCLAFALDNLRTRYRIKSSAMRAEEGVAFRNWSDVRHSDLPNSEPSGPRQI
jgi:hypothetical protein